MQNKTTKTFLTACFLIVMLFGLAIIPSGCGKSSVNNPASSTAAKTKYSCPMHPSVIDDKPSNCPICGMRLELVNVSSEKTEKGNGLATITVSPEMRQQIGVTLGIVEKRAVKKTIRTSAIIVPDERKIFRVTTKIGGWVEKLDISFTGQSVGKGDPLLSIYSQELLSSEQEYLSALKAVKDMPKTTSGVVQESARSVLEATKRRLELWDITEEQIARLEQAGQPEKTMTLRSSANGIVLEKMVIAGQKIMPGDSLMVVADLSSVWADADIHESDIEFVKTGIDVEISVPSIPGKVFKGKISFISPVLDPETRTAKARLEIPNQDLILKPGMLADAVISRDLGEKLSVPENAIMRSGLHTTAFRDGGDGKLIPVEVKTGLHAESFYEVLDGLNEGDKVVTSANFLIDSESSRRAALNAMTTDKKQ